MTTPPDAVPEVRDREAARKVMRALALVLAGEDMSDPEPWADAECETLVATALAQARREGMQEAAKVCEAAAKSNRDTAAEPDVVGGPCERLCLDRADAMEVCAAAIRAAAGEGTQ